MTRKAWSSMEELLYCSFQGHPSNFKVTWDPKLPILTQVGCFRTVTPVWIDLWQRNYVHSLKWHRKGVLLLFKVIRQISKCLQPYDWSNSYHAFTEKVVQIDFQTWSVNFYRIRQTGFIPNQTAVIALRLTPVIVSAYFKKNNGIGFKCVASF